MAGKGNEAKQKGSDDRMKLPVWVTVVVTLVGALIAAAAGYFPKMSEVNLEREKFKAEQQRANQEQERANKLESQPGKTVRLDGRYEWQWAGDGWIGHLSVARDGAARLEMKRYINCAGSQRLVSLLEQKGEGKAELVEDSTKLSVSIPVQFINYDSNCNRTGMNALTTLKGDLDRHVAYAGKIEYRTDSGEPLGDMVLVKDYFSGRE